MTGELDIDNSDLMAFAAATLCEAGLRTRLGKEPPPLGIASVECEAIDATEIICVIEFFYTDITFSQTDHNALWELTKRGHIRVDELAKWIDDCKERRTK